MNDQPTPDELVSPLLTHGPPLSGMLIKWICPECNCGAIVETVCLGCDRRPAGGDTAPVALPFIQLSPPYKVP